MNNKKRLDIFLYFFYCNIFFYFHIEYMGQLAGPSLNAPLNNSLVSNTNLNIQTENILNQYSWQNTATSTMNNDSNQIKEFNWQQRKVIKQKAYAIYANLSFIIEDIDAILEKFTSKVNNIKSVAINFSDEIKLKCNQLNVNYNKPEDFNAYVSFWLDTIAKLKKTVYYSLHKDFRKKIDIQLQNFENIKNMISHYQNSILKFYNLEDILINSVNNLNVFKDSVMAYEEKAWLKYQQLDELINDKIAEENYLEINNYSDNSISINNYLRTDFLDFFNQGMANLNNANFLILAAIDDLIKNIISTNLVIDSFNKEIQDYENAQKLKLTLELEEKMRLENELKLKEEKKKIADKLAAEQKPWYKKIIVYVLEYAHAIKILLINYYTVLIRQLVYYYNIIFKNNTPVIKRFFNTNKQDAAKLSTQVSQTVSNLPPTPDTPIEVIPFTTPTITDIPNNVSIVIPPDTNKKNILSDMPEETRIEDVFSINHQQGHNQEKIKKGPSSYPKRILNPVQLIQPTPPNQVNENEPILLLTSENIPTPKNIEAEIPEKNKSEIVPFQYQALENNINQDNQNEDPLLPDLSSLNQQTPFSANVNVGSIEYEPLGILQASNNSEKREINTNRKSKKNRTKKNNDQEEIEKPKAEILHTKTMRQRAKRT